MNLTQRCQEINQKLEQLATIEQRQRETQALDDRLKEIRDFSDFLKNFAEFGVLCTAEQVPFIVPEPASKIIEHMQDVQRQFTASRTSQDLVRGTAWKGLIREAKQFMTDGEKNIGLSWRAFCDQQYSAESYQSLLRQIPQTPENLKKIELFQGNYKRFEALRKGDPKSALSETMAEVKRIGASLQEIYHSLERDVHPEVSNFLNALASGEAYISLLTETVMKWIQESDSLDQFKVVAAHD